jgi:NAD/NADP transhydrogenase beta subunit
MTRATIRRMPIIEVDKFKAVFVLKRQHPLFLKPNTGMLYGDAKESLARLVSAVREA